MWSLRIGKRLAIFVAILCFAFVVEVVSGQQPLQWSSCDHYYDFQIPENTQFVPRSSLSKEQVMYFPIVDAINDLNSQKNQTYLTKAECSQFEVPLDHSSNTSNAHVKLFVKRIRGSKTQNAPRALWLLSGGPGLASNIFDLIMDLLSKLLGDTFDIYTTDHRGAGRSTRVTCTLTQAETLGSDEGITISQKEWTKPGCAQAFVAEWNDDRAQHFSSKAAAIDVVKLIEAINLPQNQKTFIYGASYGTVWISRIIRYLELNQKDIAQNLISGLIMDGIVNVIGKPAPMNDQPGPSENIKSGRLVLNSWDENFNGVGNALFQLCARNLTAMALAQQISPQSDTSMFAHPKAYEDVANDCRERFEKQLIEHDNDMTLYVRRVLNNVYHQETGSSCRPVRDSLSELQLKTLFQILLADLYGRVLIPAIIYRLDRCDEFLDIPFLLHVNDVVMNAPAPSPQLVPLQSPVLQAHITYSELWNPNFSIQQMLSEYNSTNTTFGGEVIRMASLFRITEWPTYQLDSDYFEKSFSLPNKIPLLMMNGNLDPQTPLWSALSQNASIQNENSNSDDNGLYDLVIVPFSPHGVVVGPTSRNSLIPVGLQLLVNFITMEEPNPFTLNRTCLDQVEFNFTGSLYYNQRMYGVYNLYEDSYYADNGRNATVSLYLMVGLLVGTLIVAITVMNGLIYFIITLRDKKKMKVLEDDIE
ncbi:hypothetical protein C9374_004670 [Naegleria lovaniensis]|uniref:Peptidase S33 tripeptidyl aminopeptidase-like C-terminal domain-containing protein n=1 Tax=Naegleria lovaniensis TaxID=51637 RepID=A0AA88GRW6_NAELO|nr:uncharacterized protein C9374_004670 [Naegleria lovaniensis]KAG2383333.1 hypothetical protein C9374_004670 [Naegleria lovaniensis]